MNVLGTVWTGLQRILQSARAHDQGSSQEARAHNGITPQPAEASSTPNPFQVREYQVQDPLQTHYMCSTISLSESKLTMCMASLQANWSRDLICPESLDVGMC
jgi:hypothetical protein